jgi:hypothetical protein
MSGDLTALETALELRVEQLMPGDVIRLQGNVWVVEDLRLGADDVCFLATLGGHVHACDHAQPVQLLGAQAGSFATDSRYSADAENVPPAPSLLSV